MDIKKLGRPVPIVLIEPIIMAIRLLEIIIPEQYVNREKA
jgi:hypothetical protein